MSHAIHDQKLLREKAYADDSRLDVRRRTHQLYDLHPMDFGRWTLERLAWCGDERVLDVGCGPGNLLRAMAREHKGWGDLVGCDLSAGMIAEARAASAGLPVRWFVADAQALPLPDARFDVVMARHMLYHVPNIDRAMAEAARLLRPGGCFLAVTNSAHTMPEYAALLAQAAARFPAVAGPQLSSGRFSLENGAAFFEPYFERVEVHTLPGALRFPAARPLVDYVASARALIMSPDHTEAEWLAVLDFCRAEAEAVIAREGHFDVTKLAGALTGVKGD